MQQQAMAVSARVIAAAPPCASSIIPKFSGYSSFIPEDFITSAQFGASSATKAEKYPGVPGLHIRAESGQAFHASRRP